MHAFWLVLTYDLLEDRRIDDVIIKTFWRHLWSITEQTHGNLEYICLMDNHVTVVKGVVTSRIKIM